MERELKYETTLKEDVLAVHLSGSLEVDLQPQILSILQDESQKEKDIVVDFSKVSFIDSSCLGALVSAAKLLRASQGDIKLASLNDDVRSIFQITRLDRIFAIFDTVDEAVASYYK